MVRGIYILGNDRVMDDAIALLSSIRVYDSETPIALIPYDDQYLNLATILSEKFGVQLYPDLGLVERISQNLHEIFGTEFFARSNQFRKQACWYGPFDEFLYIDTDIVVFEKIIDTLNYLKEYDFLSCDYQHKGGIANVFTPEIFAAGVLEPTAAEAVFNCGFWASKKNWITEEQLYRIFKDCAAHPEYFDFSQKTSDQPIINYLILKTTPKRLNLTQHISDEPGNWGGSSHFQQRLEAGVPVLYDQQKRLRYLHWAGIKMEPGAPYYDLWAFYRYRGETPPQTAPWQTFQTILGNNRRKLWSQYKPWLKRILPVQWK